MGIFAFQGFVVATLLAILAGMLIISDHPVAVSVMSICFVANIVVLVMRLFYPPWPYNISILAVGWFAIAITLGTVVAQAVFRRGRVTYRRKSARPLYLLIAVAFGALFVLIGLSDPDAFKGITFEDNPGLSNSVVYLSFVTLTSTDRRHCSRASDCAELMQHRKYCWSALSGHVIGEACNARNERAQQRSLKAAIGTFSDMAARPLCVFAIGEKADLAHMGRNRRE